MKIVVGLGNPGKRYEGTRHNIGFDVVDVLSSRHGGRYRRAWRASSLVSRITLEGEDVLLVKPQTFMNRSGHAVASLMRKKGAELGDVILVFDDADLEIGSVRVRMKGGAGSHNGVQSVIDALGSGEFSRVRVGIGPRPKGEEMVQFVLSRFSSSERRKADEAAERSADAIEHVVRDGVESAMNSFN